jgi:hypothetical protein
MITIQLTNGNPYPIYTGMATKIQQPSLPLIIPGAENDFCYCHYECAYTEKVFGSVSSNDYWKNDKNTFIYRRLIAADTVTIKLLKDNVEIATITDNTYGEFINGYPSGTPEQQLYVVFTVFWQNVLIAFGGGSYKIEAELNILGSSTTETSREFKLYAYSDLNADGTVRIETVQNGNIMSSEFDFTDLELYQSYRIPGKFTEVTPGIEDDSYLDSNYKKTQIQTKLIPKWLLRTKRIPRAISLLLTRDSILANEFLITDYNIINEDIFRRVNLYVEGIEKPDIGKTTRPIYEVTFIDKVDDKLKRNN